MKKENRNRPLDLDTLMVHGGVARSQHKETAEALYMTSGYVYDDAEEAMAAFDRSRPRFVYTRFNNPTVEMFESRMALLEGAEAARATTTGMAAIFAALASMVKAGDRVVAGNALFGSCTYIIGTLLPKWGVETEFVDGRDIDAWKRALNRPTRAVLIETPSNPSLRLADIAAISDLAHQAGAMVIVDNAFATPFLQRPLELGADIVFYSATKHIDGQGRCMGGVVLGSRSYIEETLLPFVRHTGPAISPFNAWLLLKGLETLHLRIDRHGQNALAIAEAFQNHAACKVLYPTLPTHPQQALALRQMKGGGSMLAFDFKGGREAAFRFLNALKVVLISNNLGDAKSMATHPATTTHQSLTEQDRATQGIGPGLVRLSVGLEAAEDLIADIAQALEHI